MDNPYVTLVDIILAAPIMLISTVFWVCVSLVAGVVFSLITATVKLIAMKKEDE